MAILLALSANFVFAFAATLFADFSRRVSGKWINCFKAFVGFACFGVTALIFRDTILQNNIPLYLLSGALGVFLSDHFLCEAFAKLGSARTLMIFSFNPLFVAIWSFVFFGENFDFSKLIAIFFFIACVATLSYEKFKTEGHWEIRGLLMALLGILLDGFSNIATSAAFRASPGDGVFTVCFLRSLGGVICFLIFGRYLKINLISNYKALPIPKKKLVFFASFLGAFLSLSFWISAVKMGNLTTLIALSVTTPLFAAIFEIAMGKTKATRQLIYAFLLFLAGFWLLMSKS